MTAAERERLARILGMLGSEYEGERASAALQAEAFRKKHGLTWAELLTLPPVEVVVVMKPDPAMAAQQAQWAAEDAARKARWTAPEPPPPRPPPRPARKQQPPPPPPPQPNPTDRWDLNMFTLTVMAGTAALLRLFFS